MIALIETKY